MKKILFLFAISTLLLAACSNEENHSAFPVDDSLDGLAYNMKEDKWSPLMADYLSQVDNPVVADTYKLAMENPDVLNHMPCYCGCYESSGHEHNTHCFVDGVNGDIAHLDNMGLG